MERQSILWALISFVSSLALSGCAAVGPLVSVIGGTAPNTSLEIHTQTEVKLQEGNFVTIRTNVFGSSEGFKLLGFITFRPATLGEAMNRLYADAEVEHGRPQTLAHLIVEHSGIYVILFSIPKVTVRADVVEFLPVQDQEESAPPSNDIQRISSKFVPITRP